MTKKRNGYLDVIKFLFAIIIAEFHVGAGVFPGGRLAVEGFFMITGYFMMNSIEKDKYSAEQAGLSTVKFLIRKYKGLFFILLSSAIVGFVVHCVSYSFTGEVSFQKLLLLSFDVFPLNAAGFKGFYIVGISWYLSAMFIALAILYPLVRKFKTNFVLIVCPLIVFLGYGILSAKYGNLAVGTTYIENTLLHTGIIRGLSGCAAGCLIYEISKRIGGKELTRFARISFTALELLAFAMMFYLMHNLPKSQFDYVLVFIIFGMLLIGINGLSYTSYLWNPKWTKPFGTMSTLIVLNHFYWIHFISTKLKHWERNEKIWAFFGFCICSCIVVYLMSRAIELIFSKLFQKKLWIKEKATEENSPDAQ